jgi:tRNA pseudouridine(38-40) synthase
MEIEGFRVRLNKDILQGASSRAFPVRCNFIAMIVLHPLLRINSFVGTAARKFIQPTFREGRQSYFSAPHVATMSLSSRSIESTACSARQQYIRGEVPRATVKRKIVIYIGYNGAPYHGFQRNDGVETVSDVLERALHKAGAISDGNLGFLSKISWIVSARTDKGVSAAGNAVSFKAAFPRVTSEVADQEQLSLDFSTFLKDVNAVLPPEVRVFGANKTTRSFSAKDACAGRHYEYLLPLDALSPNCSLKEYADILHHFEGSHYFHNFTIGKEHRIPPPPQVSPEALVFARCQS